MPFPRPDPNHVITRESITVYPDTGGQVGDSAYVSEQFGDPHEIVASVRPDTDDPSQFNVDAIGGVDEGGERLILNVPTAHIDAVEIDDSVDYKSQAWRLTERQTATRFDFERYLLVPDNRRVADGS